MNPMIIAALAGAGMGLIQGEEAKRNHKKQMKVESVKQRWSAFTKQRGQNLAAPSSIAPVMQGAMAGAMFGQQFNAAPAGGPPTSVADRNAYEAKPGFVGPPSGASNQSVALTGQQPMQYNAYAGGPATMPGAPMVNADGTLMMGPDGQVMRYGRGG